MRLLTQVSQCTDLLGHSQTLLVVDKGSLRLICAGAIIHGSLVLFLVLARALAQVALERDQYEPYTGTIVGNLANPFRFYIFQ